jgi:hypothetical protein
MFHNCNICGYKTKKKSSLKKHLLSKKHEEKMDNDSNEENNKMDYKLTPTQTLECASQVKPYMTYLEGLCQKLLDKKTKELDNEIKVHGKNVNKLTEDKKSLIKVLDDIITGKLEEAIVVSIMESNGFVYTR